MSRISERVRFESHTNHSLAGIIDRPSQGVPRAVVVFSHCFTCGKDLKTIVRISRVLASHGIAVLRFDMAGIGESGGDFSASNFHTNQLDVRAAIAFAAERVGPVTGLVGHSFGGAASLAIAGDSPPAALSAVVTVAAPSDTTHLAALLDRMNPEIARAGHGRVTIGARDWTVRRETLDDFREQDLPGRIAKVAVPTLIFHSPADDTVAFDHALRIQSLIQGSERDGTASLVTLPGADHLMIGDQRDVGFVAETTAAFLLRYAASG